MPTMGTSDDVVFVVVVVASVLLFLLGVIERRRHQIDLTRVPWRLVVNGSRGKSTVTRLLTGAFAAAGYRTLGKTTGTEARLILGWSGEEEPIHRRPEGPNIGEQRQLLRRAGAEDADAVVAECMAITPEYQATFHRELLDANVLLITNALDDHLEEMGPTAADVADVFAENVPAGGTLVVGPGPHLDRYREAAEEAGATLLVADPSEIGDSLLRRFDHLVWPDHVAGVLALTRHFGIEDGVAVSGMLAAPPDPFATRLLPVGDAVDPAMFVNAFPANDPRSTLGVWHHVRERGYPSEGLVVIMNCRDDRIDRTRRFARSVLPELPIDTLLITGAATRAVTDAVDEGRITARDVHDLTGEDADAVVEVLRDRLAGRVVLGVGNLHGGGAEIVAALEGLAVDPAVAGRETV
jgi:gamma-polyglutamate synthase